MLTQGRGVRWHLPFRPVGLSPVFNHFSRDGGRLPRHAFPPIIPTPVSCNCGAAYPPLRGSREFFGFSHLPFAKKFCKDLRPGTGGRLCSPNLRFWRPALSIELHPYMCASRLNCHTPHIGPDCGTLAQFSAGQRLLEGPEAEVNLRAEGKRSGSAEIRPHTPIFAQIQRLKHNILWNL